MKVILWPFLGKNEERTKVIFATGVHHPIAKMTFSWTLNSVVVISQWLVFSLDVKNAFYVALSLRRSI